MAKSTQDKINVYDILDKNCYGLGTSLGYCIALDDAVDAVETHIIPALSTQDEEFDIKEFMRKYMKWDTPRDIQVIETWVVENMLKELASIYSIKLKK